MSKEIEQLQLIAENAREITGVPFTLLSLLNEKTNMLEFKVIGGINTPLMRTALKAAEKGNFKPFEYSHSFDVNPYVKKIVETKRYQITELYGAVENMFSKPLAVAGNTILRIKKVVAFPVLIREKVMGIMVYMSQKDVEEHDIRTMQAFVDQVSLLVYNIQLSKEARTKAGELEEAKAGLEESVKERTKELEEARNNLELKVKERTKKLEDSRSAMIYLLEDISRTKTELENAKIGLEEKVKERIAELGQTYQKLVKSEAAAAAAAAAAADGEKAGLIDAMPDALIVLDLDGKITALNPPYTRMFGWKPEDRIGKSFTEFKSLKAEDIGGFMKLLDKLVETGHVEPLETLIRTKDGREIPISVGYSLIKDADGNPMNIIAVLRDITELKKMEEERVKAVSAAASDKAQAEEAEKYSKKLKKAYDKLKTLDKMKSDFISLAAHELRTPLTPVKTYVEMMMDKKYGWITFRQKGKLMLINKSIDRLGILIDDMLNITRIEAGKLEAMKKPLYIGEIVDTALDEALSLLGERKHRITIDVPDDLPPVYADEKLIVKVFSNLLNNAMKYTHARGKITVTAKSEGKNIHITIADTGIGIPKKEQTKIFEKFYVSDVIHTPRHRGIGLGLAIAKGIVKTHNGKIWAESKGLGEGSTFHVLLPVMEKEK